VAIIEWQLRSKSKYRCVLAAARGQGQLYPDGNLLRPVTALGRAISKDEYLLGAITGISAVIQIQPTSKMVRPKYIDISEYMNPKSFGVWRGISLLELVKNRARPDSC